MPEMIPSELVIIYEYEIIQELESIEIKCKHPETFDPNSIQITLNSDKTAISSRIKSGLPPLFEGLLQYPIESAAIKIKSPTVFHFVLTKTEKVDWEALIVDENPDTHNIDPASAFFIYHALNSDPDKQAFANSMLGRSANAGFPPAMNQLALTIAEDPDNVEKACKLLTVVCKLYDDAPAHFHLGSLLLNTDMDQGIVHLLQACQAEYPPAYTMMGLIYSPYSKIPYPDKDAVKALHCFNHGSESVMDYHEMAMIYHYGAEGVPIDTQKALELQNKAVTLDEHCPGFDALPDK